MAFNPITSPHVYSDEEFYGTIELLKRKKALPQDSFIQNIPFFNFPSLSKEFQVKELFLESWDANMSRALLKNIVPSEALENGSSCCSPLVRLSTSHMMTFAQLCLYKVLPCPDPNCRNRPREIVTHNQYKDFEYECPFYHHERDRRRIMITPAFDEEFLYKANYYEEGRSHAEKDKYSQNYFESMFHPLYYKMFRCKREFCSSSQFCPFYHHEQEKKTWDKMFGNFIKKDRITYVKDKQKYYESTSQNNTPFLKGYNANLELSQSPTKSSDFGERQPQRRPKNQQQQRGVANSQNQNPNLPLEMKGRGKIQQQQQQQQFSQRKIGDWQKSSDASRKNSNDSFGLNTEHFGILNTTKQIAQYRAC